MAKHDPRFDTCIANAADFARPILEHLREQLHATCPEAEESMKWSMPCFSYRSSPLCMMAAFRQHCGFAFWLAREVVGETSKQGMGQFGKLVSVKDLPSKPRLTGYLRKAMALNEAGVKVARPRTAAKPAPVVPDDLGELLVQKKYAAARKTYASFSPAGQREYIDWIAEAKTDATRRKRIASTLEWLAEGKHRNWKYQKC